MSESTPRTIITRITTVNGTDVSINGGAPVALLGLIGDAANTTAVTIKDGATTISVLAAGAIPLAGGVGFGGAEFRAGLIINIAATGIPLVVVWSPL